MEKTEFYHGNFIQTQNIKRETINKMYSRIEGIRDKL